MARRTFFQDGEQGPRQLEIGKVLTAKSHCEPDTVNDSKDLASPLSISAWPWITTHASRFEPLPL